MKKNILLFLSLFLLFTMSGSFISCKKKSDTLYDNIKTAIFNKEKDEYPIDSITIVSIDSLTHYGYIKIILEQLENMEYEYLSQLECITFASPEEKMEFEIIIEEISGTIEHLRQKTEDNTNNTDFFCYFISAELWIQDDVHLFYYLMTPEYSILDDPFSDNLID